MRMVKACSRKDVDIQDIGMFSLDEKTGLKEHVEDLDRGDLPLRK